MCTYTCIHVSHLYRHIPHIYPKSNLLPSFHNQSSRKWVSQILVSFHFRGPIFHFHFLWGERVSPQKLSPPPVSMTKSTTPQLQTSPPKDFSTIFHRRFLGDVFFFWGDHKWLRFFMTSFVVSNGKLLVLEKTSPHLCVGIFAE